MCEGFAGIRVPFFWVEREHVKRSGRVISGSITPLAAQQRDYRDPGVEAFLGARKKTYGETLSMVL